MSWKSTWKNPQPVIEFIVNHKNRRSLMTVLTAHKYLLAMASPVFKEQFYGKPGRFEYSNQESTQVQINLDVGARAAEAFLAHIYQKPFGDLCLKDTLQLLELSERYQMDQLRDYAKERIASLKHESEDVCVMSTEDQDDILRQIWEEDQEMTMWQRDQEKSKSDAMIQFLLNEEDEDEMKQIWKEAQEMAKWLRDNEVSEWETMRKVFSAEEDECEISTEEQDDIQRQMWEEDQEMAKWQRDQEKSELEKMREYFSNEEDECEVKQMCEEKRVEEDKYSLSIQEQDDIQKQIWKEDEMMVRCQYEELVFDAWLNDEETIMREVHSSYECYAYSRRNRFWNINRPNRRALPFLPEGWIRNRTPGAPSEVDRKVDMGGYFRKKDQGMAEGSIVNKVQLGAVEKRQEKRMANFKSLNEPIPKSKKNGVNEASINDPLKPGNLCTNSSKICRNNKKRKCSFNLCKACCKKQNQLCRGHPQK